MSDLADLFPGFESHWIPTPAGKTFARSGGKGPPLLLVHGYPQSHVMWHRIAPRLAERFHVVCPDLRGYGWSSAPRPDAGHLAYSKSAMADDMIAVMEALGHIRFAAAGHDRGARVAYRLALDHPGRLSRLSVLDIVPTIAMWEMIEASPSPKTDHWLFLAGPAPGPETAILADPWAWQSSKLALWTAAGDLSAYDRRALAHYRAFFDNPDRIRASCEDYRAGATVDRRMDAADRAAGRRIACPVQVLWGNAGIPAAGSGPLAAWRDFAPDAVGAGIASGHFMPEENPEATLAALLAFHAP
jgi:haloacetate dehalogenase